MEKDYEPSERKNHKMTLLHWLYLLLSAAILIGLDQWTKLLAIRNLTDGQGTVTRSIPIIKGVLEFSYVENTGAAFSMFSGKLVLLVVSTVIVMIYLFFTYPRIPAGRHYYPIRVIYSMLIAGAIGNMIDRLARKYVVDFIYFKLIDFPVFNVADIFVTCSVILIALYGFLFYKGEELDFLFHLKQK